VVLDRLRRNWREVAPSDNLRERAEALVDRFPLTAADALQLASALAWCSGHPRNRPFISGDAQLLVAAGRLGFKAIAT
jgi:predicted nucleic acid-binding protein